MINESPVVSFSRLANGQTQTDEFDDDEFAELAATDDFDDDEFAAVETDKEDDPDRQGSIRVVKGAHLVYKRKNETNQYEELWVYKQDMLVKNNTTIYAAIIAGTDIEQNRKASNDGSQTVDTWEIGQPSNTLVYVNIKGLPN